ncbi:MAG: 6-phosphogluconolactonase [Spirochaetaceae bacterium]
MEILKAADVRIHVCDDEAQMGHLAAERVVQEILDAIHRRRTPVLWLMAAPSGFAFYDSLCGMARNDSQVAEALDGIEIFQFDDYPIARDNARFPVTFRYLLEDRVIAPLTKISGVKPLWRPLELTGDREKDDAVSGSYAAEVGKRLRSKGHHVVEVKGIGMDGHWGFHGAETPLDNPPGIIRVPMNAENIAQQMLDWPQYYGMAEDVPAEAYSCNVALFMEADAVIDVVPQAAKEYSVLATYATEDVLPEIPSSAVKKHGNADAFVTAVAAGALQEFRENVATGHDPLLSETTLDRLKGIWRQQKGLPDPQKSIDVMMDVLGKISGSLG